MNEIFANEYFILNAYAELLSGILHLRQCALCLRLKMPPYTRNRGAFFWVDRISFKIMVELKFALLKMWVEMKLPLIAFSRCFTFNFFFFL